MITHKQRIEGCIGRKNFRSPGIRYVGATF